MFLGLIELERGNKGREKDMVKLSAKKLNELEGKSLGQSAWLEVTQERINNFAEATEDRQWIHVDPEKAARSPLKSTVAHGFLLLSLLPFFLSQCEIFQTKFRFAVNYGLNRVRFTSPVHTGDRIRNQASLKKVEKKGLRKVMLTIENTVEIEGKEKPALVAEILVLFYL